MGTPTPSKAQNRPFSKIMSHFKICISLIMRIIIFRCDVTLILNFLTRATLMGMREVVTQPHITHANKAIAIGCGELTMFTWSVCPRIWFHPQSGEKWSESQKVRAYNLWYLLSLYSIIMRLNLRLLPFFLHERTKWYGNAGELTTNWFERE